VSEQHRYYRISPRFWQDERVMRWDDDTRLLALYLLTCPHRNMTGLYVLPLSYAAEDLGWDMDRIRMAFQRLSNEGFCTYHEPTRTILIHNALKYDSPSTEKHITGWVKVLKELPETPLLAGLLAAAERYAPKLADAIRMAFPMVFEWQSNNATVTVTASTAVAVAVDTARARAREDDDGDDDANEPLPSVAAAGNARAEAHTPRLDRFYQEHFGFNAWNLSQLRAYVERGMDEEAVIYALELALERGATQGVKFPRAILDSWWASGIRTREQAERAEHEFRERKRLGRARDGPAASTRRSSDRPVPSDWLEEELEHRKALQELLGQVGRTPG